MESKQGEEINLLKILFSGCATSILVTSAGMGEMVMQVLVGSVSLMSIFMIIEKECVQTLRIRLIIAKPSPVEI